MKPGWYAPIKGKFRARLAHYFVEKKVDWDNKAHWWSLCRGWAFSKAYWQPENTTPHVAKCRTCLFLERKLKA